MKRAEYINKNNGIIQEFPFSHPKAIFHLNKVYNSHFSGSCLWDLISRDALMLENIWNVSIRLRFDLTIQTHTWYIEPLSETCHVKNILVKNFLTFVQAIKSSHKLILTKPFQDDF